MTAEFIIDRMKRIAHTIYRPRDAKDRGGAKGANEKPKHIEHDISPPSYAEPISSGP